MAFRYPLLHDNLLIYIYLLKNRVVFIVLFVLSDFLGYMGGYIEFFVLYLPKKL